jgi:hypothetical protein
MQQHQEHPGQATAAGRGISNRRDANNSYQSKRRHQQQTYQEHQEQATAAGR